MRLIDIFHDYSGRDSLFQKMVSLGAPWPEDIALDMDIMYFTCYSGFKKATSFVELNIDNGVVDSTLIARLIYTMCAVNWKHIWNAYNSDYSPLHNYDMTETIARKLVNEENRDLSRETREHNTAIYTTAQKGHSKTSDVASSSSDRNDSGHNTETLEHGHTVSSQTSTSNSVYGFNSVTAVPSAESTGTESATNGGTDTTVTSTSLMSHSTDSVNRNIGTEDGRDDTRHDDEERKSVTTDGGNVTVNNTEDVTTQRSGNIGVTTSQQLLQSEISLWKWNFYKSVFDDVDTYMALSLFDMPSKKYNQ